MIADPPVNADDRGHVLDAQAAVLGDLAHDVLAAGLRSARRRLDDLARADDRTRALYEELRRRSGGLL